MCTFNTIVSSLVNTIVFQNANIFCNNEIMTIGTRIKAARSYAKLSRGDLADAVECSYDLLTKLENDKRAGTLFLSKIAKACNVDFNWLDSGEGEMVITDYPLADTPEAQILKAMENMDAATKYQLVKIGNSLAEPAEKPNGTQK